MRKYPIGVFFLFFSFLFLQFLANSIGRVWKGSWFFIGVRGVIYRSLAKQEISKFRALLLRLSSDRAIVREWNGRKGEKSFYDFGASIGQ